MNVLIIARFKNGHFAPFITEQVDALEKKGVICKYLAVKGKGFLSYIRQFPKLRKAIREFHPDIIHAHYGLCGLLANYQHIVPTVTTYHGSDINNPKILRISRKVIQRSRFNIFVSQEIVDIAKPNNNFAIIPCGINLEDYPIIDKVDARRRLDLEAAKKYILFAGAFDNPVKNASLAKAAVELVPDAEIHELKGYTRAEVATLLQAVDCMLMTSLSEGSPQVIKEAMACGCPIVSVDVGDVKEIVTNIAGCFIAERNPHDIALKINEALDYGCRTKGRSAISEKGLTNNDVVSKIIEVYTSCLQNS